MEEDKHRSTPPPPPPSDSQKTNNTGADEEKITNESEPKLRGKAVAELPRTEKRHERERERENQRKSKRQGIGKEAKKGSGGSPEQKEERLRMQRHQAEEGVGKGG